MAGRALARNVVSRSPCFFLALTLAAVGCKKETPPAATPEVQVLTVESRDVPLFDEWIGALDGFVNAGIRAQVTGYLQRQIYREGSIVKKGDLLFQIDPRPFQAVLDQARARLAASRAQSGKAELDVKRFTPLAKEQALSQEQLDDAVQADLSAKAQVQADESAVETAQLNLDFTRITSPIDGIAGIALAQVGDLLSPSSGLLTTVSTVDPIKALFNVNEQSYLTFWRDQILKTENGTNLPLQLLLSDGSVYPGMGKVFFADRQVNPSTGTLQIVGTFPNPTSLLRPGQYGRVRAQTQLKRGAILVPQRAVTELQGSYQVAVVQDEVDEKTHQPATKAHLKPVQVGAQTGANWVIDDGLKPGDRVVVEGLQKATEGATVIAQPYAPPTRRPAP